MRLFDDVSTHSRPKAAGILTADINLTIQFQHTAARRRLEKYFALHQSLRQFQHTAARRRLVGVGSSFSLWGGFNTQPPEGGWGIFCLPYRSLAGFNTQPPEGGWSCLRLRRPCVPGFQHTAARRRLVLSSSINSTLGEVSTHSRPKAAGCQIRKLLIVLKVSTHSRPKAAGGYKLLTGLGQKVSTHSRPKAAGKHICIVHICIHVSTHSRPKAAG